MIGTLLLAITMTANAGGLTQLEDLCERQPTTDQPVVGADMTEGILLLGVNEPVEFVGVDMDHVIQILAVDPFAQEMYLVAAYGSVAEPSKRTRKRILKRVDRLTDRMYEDSSTIVWQDESVYPSNYDPFIIMDLDYDTITVGCTP